MNQIINNKNHFLFLAIISVVLLNYFQFFFNSETINFLFTDDLWVIVGDKYDSLFEKYFCCSVISPFASIYFQTLYSFSSTDQIFINLLFIVGQLLPLSLFSLKHLPVSRFVKTVAIICLLSSPMYLNYSLRPKPYIFEIIIVFIVINLFFKVIDTKNIGLGDFLLLSIMTLFSLVTVIVVLSCSLLLLINLLLKKRSVRFSMFGFSVFAASTLAFFYFANLLKNDALDNFWSSYFFPLEGGLDQQIRWLYFSLIRLLSESDTTNLGFSNFSTTISIMLLLVAIYSLIKNNRILFFIIFTLFAIALLLAGLQLYPFGGTRTNIYLFSVLSICFAYAIAHMSKIRYFSETNFLLIIVLIVLISNFNKNSISYSNTTNSINKSTVELIIQDITKDKTKVLVHHGSHWFVGNYFPVEIEMEEIKFFPSEARILGSGGLSIPAPIILNEQYIQLCYDFPQTKSLNCLDVLENYLNESKIESFKFVGFYVEDVDWKGYLEVFKKNNFKIEKIASEDNIVYYLIKNY